MSIALGTQNKKQVRIAAALLVAVALLAWWDLRSGTPKASSAPPRHLVTVSAADHPQKTARDAEMSGADFHLRLGELARSESVGYLNGGKDLFSAAPNAPAIETPLAPARPAAPILPAPAPPAKPAIPEMNLKYLGYAESGGSTNMNALFLHGEDMFVAKTGDIMFHRFQVGPIRVSSVEVTDLTDNRKQTIPVAAD